MLENLVRKAVFMAALALAFAPVAAEAPVADTVETVADQIPNDPLGDLPSDPDAAQAEASPAPPTATEDVVPTVDLPPVDTHDARQAIRDGRASVDALAAEIAATIHGVLPPDPVVFVQRQLQPVSDTANQVQSAIFAEEAPQEQPQMGTASVGEVVLPYEQALLVAGATAAAAAALALLWLAGSSSSMGAGAASAAGTGSKLASTDLKRLLPFASPLFTRFEKDTVLGHPKREALYALILQAPGVSLQALCDSTGLSRTAVTHHLRLLELQHLIVSKRMGRSRHYYENGGRFGRDQKEALAVLQNGRSKEVATFVKEHPGAIQKALCEALGLQPSIAHWHLARLQQAQLVESVRSGRTVSYFPGASLRAAEQPVVPASVFAAPTPA